MRDEKYRKSKLVSIALMGYFFQCKAESIEINIEYKDHMFKLNSRANINQKIENLHELEEILNSKQSDDLEMYYTELLDSFHGSNRDLNLLSSLVDRAKVDYKDNILEIIIEKNF